MKKILFFTLVLFMAIACAKEEGMITGTASAGDTVAGITVKLYSDSAMPIDETTTDNAGNFAFHDLEDGNYYIGATITIGGEVWDTGNRPQMIYVSGDIVKEVSLSLSKK